MEIFENTAANNAGVAKRAIERLLTVITNGERERAGIDRSNIAQLEEVLDTLILVESLNKDALEDKKNQLEGANSDGFLFNEYHEYDNLS
tara:strand:+ start:383 stop:652 length:270 start_codon:yes stop_codon:yes gene_type:complete